MKYLIVRIQENSSEMNIFVDNCSREDATENEQMFADAFEKVLQDLTEHAIEQSKKG